MTRERDREELEGSEGERAEGEVAGGKEELEELEEGFRVDYMDPSLERLVWRVPA